VDVARALAGVARQARGETLLHNAARQAADDLLEHAARGERARIASELHDVVAHHISMIAVQAETARLATPGLPAKASNALPRSARRSHTALTKMRRLLGVLREDARADPPDLLPQPGPEQLNELLDQARDASGSARSVGNKQTGPATGGGSSSKRRYRSTQTERSCEDDCTGNSDHHRGQSRLVLGWSLASDPLSPRRRAGAGAILECVNRAHHWYCAREAWKRHVRDELVPPALEGLDLGDSVLEVGPGFGPGTEMLAGMGGRLTALEIDPGLASALRDRLGDRVDVVQGDASAMPFADGSFSAAAYFTMLHHVPSPEAQNRLFAEVHRVPRPGAPFAGTDSTGRGIGFAAAPGRHQGARRP
jgi:hypothetical protein